MGGPIRGLQTDHVISGQMRGLKKLNPMAQTNRQTDGHGNSMTELAKCFDSMKIMHTGGTESFNYADRSTNTKTVCKKNL